MEQNMSRAAPLLTTIIQAGAGTGKTQRLASEILVTASRLIEQNEGRIPRIVATTFTERATSELKERVFSFLPIWSEHPHYESICRFVREPGYLIVSTIHGVFSSILHRHGPEIGIDPQFQIISSSQEVDLRNSTLREVLARGFEGLLEDYSFFELADMVETLSDLLDDPSRPAKSAPSGVKEIEEQIRDAKEASSRLGEMDLDSAGGKTAENLKELSAALKVVTKEENPHFYQVQLSDLLSEIRKPSVKKVLDIQAVIDILYGFRDRWQKDSGLLSVALKSEEVSKSIEALAKEFLKAWHQVKQQRGVLTFSDLELRLVELATLKPKLIEASRSEYDYWFVDEYQDTSPLQKSLIWQLFKNPWNAFFVGDPQQSIYLFRGSDKRVFESTITEVGARGGQVLSLTENYRSTPLLIDFFNKLFARSTLQPFQPLQSPNPDPSRPAKAKSGLSEVRFHFSPKTKIDDDLPILFSQVNDWVQSGVTFEQISVLVRTNKRGREVADYLARRKVPVYLHEAGGFFTQRINCDLFFILNFINFPSEDSCLVGLLRAPFSSVDDNTLVEWCENRPDDKSLWEWLTLNEKSSQNVTIGMLKSLLTDSLTLSPSQVLEEAMERFGILEFANYFDSSGRNEANARKFLTYLVDAEKAPDFNLSHFLREVQTQMDSGGDDVEAACFVEPKRVNILTVHKSKGLKFDYVIVPDCSDSLRENSLGRYVEISPDGEWAIKVSHPDQEKLVESFGYKELKSQRSGRELEEHQRLFYVALTRAAFGLSLIGEEKIPAKSWFSLFGVQAELPLGEETVVCDSNLWAEEDLVKVLEQKFDHQMLEKKGKFVEGEAGLVVTHAGVFAAIQKFNTLKESSRAKSLTRHRMTVSELVELGTGDVLKKLPLSRQIALSQKGIAYHFFFELYSKDGFEDIAKTCKVVEKRYHLSEPLDQIKIQKVFETADFDLKSLIKSGRREFGFIVRLDDFKKEMEGQIDLFGEVDGETVVVDYKTFKNGTEASYEKAFWQLNLYAFALRKLYPDLAQKKIKLAVVAPLNSDRPIDSKVAMTAEAMVAELALLVPADHSQHPS